MFGEKQFWKRPPNKYAWYCPHCNETDFGYNWHNAVYNLRQHMQAKHNTRFLPRDWRILYCIERLID